MKNFILPKKFIFIVIFIIAGLLLTACGETPQTYTIGVVNLTSSLDGTIEVFKEGMTELEYIEDENITYLYEGAAGIDKLDAAAQKLVAADVDLILSLTTPATLAAQRATAGTDVPVVFIAVNDPVGAGIVDSLTRPGGNVTGITYTSQEGRRLEWLTQVDPTIEQVYIAYNPKDQGSMLALKAANATAAQLGVELITREASTPEEITAVFENIPEEADAIFFLPDSLTNARIADWLEMATQLKLPTSGSNTELAETGTLTAYGIDLNASTKQEGARLADQILRGTKPADLPVEIADFFSVVNLKTGEAIGLDIPDAILRQTDIVIR